MYWGESPALFTKSPPQITAGHLPPRVALERIAWTASFSALVGPWRCLSGFFGRPAVSSHRPQSGFRASRHEAHRWVVLIIAPLKLSGFLWLGSLGSRFLLVIKVSNWGYPQPSTWEGDFDSWSRMAPVLVSHLKKTRRRGEGFEKPLNARGTNPFWLRK